MIRLWMTNWIYIDVSLWVLCAFFALKSICISGSLDGCYVGRTNLTVVWAGSIQFGSLLAIVDLLLLLLLIARRMCRTIGRSFTVLIRLVHGRKAWREGGARGGTAERGRHGGNAKTSMNDLIVDMLQNKISYNLPYFLLIINNKKSKRYLLKKCWYQQWPNSYDRYM